MEVNNMVIAVFSIFLAILFSINLINNYEQAAAHIEAKKSYLEVDKNLTLSQLDSKKSAFLKSEQEAYNSLIQNLSVASNETWTSLDNVWNKTTFGKFGWTVLHVYSANYPTDPTEDEKSKLKTFLYLFGYFFPCKACAHHFIEMLNKNPIRADSREELMFYLCDLHNQVNLHLKKQIYDCQADLLKQYGGDCGCSESDGNNNTSINNATSDNGNL